MNKNKISYQKPAVRVCRTADPLCFDTNGSTIIPPDFGNGTNALENSAMAVGDDDADFSDYSSAGSAVRSRSVWDD